jgi:hypothetical protein
MTSEPFEVSDDNESLQMLTRNSQIGEFYVMAPPQVEPKDSPLHTCDIMIFDEERDSHVRISWEDAMNATLVGDDKFYAGTTPGTKMEDGTKDGKKLSDWKTAAGLWNDYNKGTAVEGGFKGLDPNVRIVVARPFIEHSMHNVIMAVAGRDTGATLFGPADMQLSANTQVKTIEGHYTGHFKAVVTKPQNVLVMRDVACAGYVAGCNTRWFATPVAGGAMSMEAAQDNLQARLSFANDDTDRYASMLAFPCYEGQFNSGQLDTVLSVTTRLLPWEVNNAGLHASFPGGDAMFNKYNAALQLSQVHYGEDMKAAENQVSPPRLRPPRRRCPLTLPFCACAGFHQPGIHKQRHVLPRPVPQVRPLHQELHVARTGPGPLWPRRHPRRRALASRGERVAQDGSRFDGLARARAARADGLLGALSALPRKRPPSGPRARPLPPPPSPPPERRHPSSCIRVCVCVC